MHNNYFNINIGNNNTSYTAEVATTSGSISGSIVSGEGELQVFDGMGHMVMTQHVNGVQTIEKPSQYGVYILKLNEKTQKIVIR